MNSFSGVPLKHLIITPLIGAVEAQSKMSEEQIRLLLNNCFHYDGEHYQPIMLQMVLTHAILDKNEDSETDLKQISTSFNLPLVTLFPFTSLCVDTVKISFEMEVTSHYTVGSEVDPKSQSSMNQSDLNNTLKRDESPVQILGKVGAARSSDEKESGGGKSTANYSVDITATPKPLSKGLLSIIELYTKAIVPTEMPTKK